MHRYRKIDLDHQIDDIEGYLESKKKSWKFIVLPLERFKKRKGEKRM